MSKSRQIDYSDDLLKKLTFDPPEPAADARSSVLWDACQDVAEDALNTKFMQGLGDGTLSPDTYGQYTVQDCAYCAAAADDYKELETLAAAANEPTLAAFAKAHYTSYNSWVVNSYLPSWHVGDPKSLVLNQAGKEYIDHEHAAVTTLHPIYGVIAQIPCERLWPWLGQQLKPASPAYNVYNSWINENYDYKHEFLLSNYIDTWFDANPDQYDHDTALFVLRGSIIGELNMFRAACGEELMAMPILPKK